MVINGSSYFRAIGGTEVTGPTGATGYSPIGATGNTGGDITEITYTGDVLSTVFTWIDGSTSGITAGGVKGATGNTWIEIDGGNTGTIFGGVTIFKEKVSEIEIVLRTIEVTGDATQISQTDDDIVILYDQGFFGYINATAGNVGELVGTDASVTRQLRGITGATYNETLNAVDVQLKNYKEKSKYLVFGTSPTDDIYNAGETGSPLYMINMNPNDAKVFEIDMKQEELTEDYGITGPISPIEFPDAVFGYTGNIQTASTNVSKAFTLIVHGATYSNQNNYQFQNVVWPFGNQPCFSGEVDIFNFFWLPCDSCTGGAAWHGNIVQWKSPTTIIISGTENDPFFCHDQSEAAGTFLNLPEGRVDFPGSERQPFGIIGATGACCNGGGECVHLPEVLCKGYYHGAGTTCGATSGNTGSICFNDTGSCCAYYTKTDTIECFDKFTSNDCINLGNVSNIETYFGGIDTTCRDRDCINASEKLGACCNGRGACSQITREECNKNAYFFFGEGTPCELYDGTKICSGGTGSCCRASGSCENNVSGATCLSDGDLYAGSSSICDDIDCDTEENSCSAPIAGLDLQPGDVYAGGVVVGLYRPFGSELFGSPSFGKDKDATSDELMIGADYSLLDNRGLTCDIYRSKYDYHGYGFDSEKGCIDYGEMTYDTSRSDAYYMIVSMSPIAIEGDREVVSVLNNPGATQEFYWGNQGSSWGPIYDRNLYDDLSDKYKTDVFKLNEGYWYNGNIGEQSLNILGNNTFPSCRKARRLGNGHTEKLITKPLQTAHGMWHRNWGLYNNIRIISADNALSQGYNDPSGAYTSSQFGPGLTGEYISAIRATRLLDDDFVGGTGATGSNIPEVSSWYLPSKDEMSFIAANSISTSPYNTNINAELLNQGGVPIEGWHWTSTGAFDETKGYTGEGTIVVGGSTAEAGSLAWAMKFDINGDESRFLVGKKNRTRNTYKVRPIRLVRCDGQYATGGQSNEKLWTLPKLLRDSDQDINQ